MSHMSAAAPAGVENVARTVEQSFRHDTARIIAVLTARFGPAYIDEIEDAVQVAVLRALERWRFSGRPANVRGWLYRAACNHLIDRTRRQGTAQRYADDPGLLDQLFPPDDADEPHFGAEIGDSEVRMLFACCHPAIPLPGQVALALKFLGGFSTAEIARCLMTGEDTAAKRVQRARRQLGDGAIALEVPPPAEMPQRLEGVLATIYAIFAAGYHSAHPDALIRRELCGDAMRLCQVLLDNPTCNRPPVRALMALMLLHAARFDARIDHAGAIVLLRDQDRGAWDGDAIRAGLAHLAASAEGDDISRYHLEAGIAARHCLASDYDSTDWPAILRDYDRLMALAPGPLYAFNRCIAVAETDGPHAALAALEQVDRDWNLSADYYLFHAARAEFRTRLGDMAGARADLRTAWRKTTSRQEQRLLERKLADLKSG